MQLRGWCIAVRLIAADSGLLQPFPLPAALRQLKTRGSRTKLKVFIALYMLMIARSLLAPYLQISKWHPCLWCCSRHALRCTPVPQRTVPISSIRAPKSRRPLQDVRSSPVEREGKASPRVGPIFWWGRGERSGCKAAELGERRGQWLEVRGSRSLTMEEMGAVGFLGKKS